MSKFKELWKNEKTNALIKMGLWFLFFLFVLIFCIFSGNGETPKKEEPKEEVKTITYSDMLNDLVSKENAYEYVITNLETKEKVRYTGKLSKDTDEGLYESKEEVFKYSCRLDKCFKVFLDHEEEFEFEKPIYANINEIISQINTMVPKESDNNNVHEYEAYDINIKVINNEENIEKIEINDNLNEYIMTFSK